MDRKVLYKSLLKCLGDFFNTFKHIENEKLKTCSNLYALELISGNRTASEELMKSAGQMLCEDQVYRFELKKMIEEKNTDLFKEVKLELLEKLDIQNWYTQLNREEMKLLWKYVKTIFNIINMVRCL